MSRWPRQYIGVEPMEFYILYDRSYVAMGDKISEMISIEDGGQIQLKPDDETYVLDLNSIPFALVGWNIGSREYDLYDSIAVTKDMLSEDDNKRLFLRVKGVYRSAYTIIVFSDDNGFIPDDAVVDETVDGKGNVVLKKRFERILRTTGSALNITLPTLYKIPDSEQSIPVQPTDTTVEEGSHMEFMGWMDLDSGAVYGAKSIYHASRRGVIYLKAKWGVKYDVPRMATVQFQIGSKGSVITGEDEEGNNTYLEGWTPDGSTLVWSEQDESNTFSFRVNSLSFKIPSTYPEYVAKNTMPRYMSYWIRVDGSEMVASSNDTNLGFNIGGETGVFSGDGFADIYYPGDTISLRVGETVQLVPVWVASYTHRLIFDISLAKSIADRFGDKDSLAEYTPRLIEWMKKNSITPIYEGEEFQFKGIWENTGAKNMIWTRMPTSSPPLFKYFRTWVAENVMYDISLNEIGGVSFEDHRSSIESAPSLDFGLQPCTSQRIGLLADENSRVYECNLIAVWNGWDGSESDFPYFPIVFEDSDWVEPIEWKGAPILPLCFIHPCTQFHDLNSHSTAIYTEFLLPGTGKTPTENIEDPRPRGGGDSLKNKAFLNWNLRINSLDGPVIGRVEAGTRVSVNITGGMMSTYYWGQFPGPEWKDNVEGVSSNPAYEYFTQGYSDEEIANGITWEMIQDKKTIWGPIYNAPTSSDGVITQIVDSPNVPDAIIVEANWRTESGTFLLRGDYTNGSATDSFSPYPDMFDLGINQSIEDTLTANLYEASTVAFGFRNHFVMDLGATRRINMKVSRVNPIGYDDAISLATDDATYYDKDGLEINKFNEEGELNKEHPAFKNKYFYSNKWSNSKWYSELRGALDFWQNSVNESHSRYGGFQIYFESPPDEDTRSGNTQGLSSLTGNRPLYPSFMYNVFLTGAISPTYNGQLLTVTIPMTLARMTTAQDDANSEGGYATHVCRLKPGDIGMGEIPGSNSESGKDLYYVDSLKASEKLLTYINYDEKDWEFVTPTDVDGWTCSRQYYEGNISTPTSSQNAYGSPASLKVIAWKAEWRIHGTSETDSNIVFAGDKLNVGKARDVTLTAVWGSTKSTAIVDLETSQVYYFDETSSKTYTIELDPSSLLDETKDMRVVIPVPKSVTKASYTICGGGGCGAQLTTMGISSGTRVIGGGGGASGEYINATHHLRQGENPAIILSVGLGGGFGEFRDGYGGETSIYEASFKSDMGIKYVDILDFNDSAVQDSVSVTTHIATANGGQPGTSGINSQGGVATTIGSASGGAGSNNYSQPGSDGMPNGNFPGGKGGSSARTTEMGGRAPKFIETYGGGGGGASRVDIHWFAPGEGDTFKEYVFRSAAGNGNGTDGGSSGVRGGGGGGGYILSHPIGGHGFAMIQFY